jgi:hypothetical protein
MTMTLHTIKGHVVSRLPSEPTRGTASAAVTPSQLAKEQTALSPVPTHTLASLDAARNRASQGNVPSGKGVLGMLIAEKAAVALPDPAVMSWQELRAVLLPAFGKSVVVTSYDREDASTLAEAKKSHSVGDTTAILVDVTAEGLVLKTGDHKPSTLHSEFWALARIKEAGGKSLAQDPTYPKHFIDC